MADADLPRLATYLRGACGDVRLLHWERDVAFCFCSTKLLCSATQSHAFASVPKLLIVVG
jgi:hypothetical protein